MAAPQESSAETDALGDQASALVDTARRVAEVQFGEHAVREIPRLVTDVAIVMSNLAVAHATRSED